MTLRWTSRAISRILFRALEPGGGHPSRDAVAGALLAETLPASKGSPAVAAYPGARAGHPRTLPVWPCSGWGLPSRAGHPARWWSLTPPFHPYRDLSRRSVLCGTFPRVTPGGRYPPPCPVESGLSSAGGVPPDAAACPARPRGVYRLPVAELSSPLGSGQRPGGARVALLQGGGWVGRNVVRVGVVHVACHPRR